MHGSTINISGDDLPAFAENVGKNIKPSHSRRGRSLARELGAKLKEMREIRDELERRGDPKDRAREWLLDNYYIARREGVLAIKELETAGKLRVDSAGRVLITELSAALVRSGGGALDKKRCELFLTGFQQSRPLSLTELSLFPAALRAALIGELLELCRKTSMPDTAGNMERIFTSLRLLGAADFSDILERVDQTEQMLREDPSGIYPHMDEKTRGEYRRRVAYLAKRMRNAEYRVARQAVKLAGQGAGRARHVGYHLYTKPLNGEKNRGFGAWYMGGNVLLTLFFSVLSGFLANSVFIALLAVFPASELVKNLMDAIFLRRVKPSHIPRMELKNGVPEGGETLCVIVSLLTDSDSAGVLVRRMEEYRLANRDSGAGLRFGLLLDLPESRESELPEAEQWISAAESETERLNLKYGGGFFLIVRERSFSERDGVYMGWERKRGALTQLMELLRGKNSGVKILAGEAQALMNTRFVLTLDSDTRLAPGTARELIGAMLHPLVRPVIDKKRRVVISGHGVIQPRMSTGLASAGRTDFARIYAGQGGTDPYGGASGEVYMDCFGRGGFAGKGIIDIDAFLNCMEGRIPENTVLSHDTLEGAYLRGGYMGDVELTDGFPSSVRSYFRRLERWTRGDWQNLPWLFKKDIQEAERWRIFDSLRRSLAAPASMAAFLTFFISPLNTWLWASGIAMLSLLSPLLLSIFEGLTRPGGSAGVRYHSSIIYGAGGALTRALLKLLFLPYEAWICASAILIALWRMSISRKRLLAWQTADQTDKGKNTVYGSYLAMWQCAAVSACLFMFSHRVTGIAAAVIWLFAPACAAMLSRDKERSSGPSKADRAYLLGCVREMWEYFEEFCTVNNNFLPPDNFQEAPPVGLARRTSPTNIGMGLLSALSAAKLGIITRARAEGMIEETLSTLERMEKWNGHLLNWYDTRSLSTLSPGYVSTVDSGNLAGCLIALREGLTQWGSDELAERADALLAAMDFSVLYDESHRLFRIGIDIETEKPTEGWYDLMSSEARLTAYVAIAQGAVDRRHWRRLGRAQVQKDGFRGMASWTGTMFEYLMPELVMPLYRDSLLYETARFCVYVQKSRTGGKVPWGISESAFFSLDTSLDYRYKAHGCAGLALKRGQDSELVISPYSSFLALAVDPKGAVRNLKRLEGFGARGRFGFWEAVDFTPARCPDEGGAVVSCVMAHHVGMSICAAANYLCGGYLQKLFMSDPVMAAHTGLLQERVPIGSVLLDSREREIPEKPRGERIAAWAEKGEGVDFLRPKAALLSNGSYKVIATETGAAIAHFGDILPYKCPERLLGSGGGIELFLQCGGEYISVLPISEPNSAGNAVWEVSGQKAAVSSSKSGIKAVAETMVCAFAPGELRRVGLTSLRGAVEDCRLEMRLEPVIARERDYVNHPAFYRLGLEKKCEEGRFLIRRLARGGMKEHWMCIDCGGGVEVKESPAGVLTLSVLVSLREGVEETANFAIAIGDTENEAKGRAERILAMKEDGAAGLIDACASLLGMDAAETERAMADIAPLAFLGAERNKGTKASEEGRDGLWRFGISGDMPIVCVRMNSLEELPEPETLLRRHALLTACGLDYDLVFILSDGGDYRKPCTTALLAALRALDRESVLGSRGGVHIADSGQNMDTLLQSAAILTDLSVPEEEPERETTAEYFLQENRPEARTAVPPCACLEDGGVEFEISGKLPKRAWTNMLTNGRFGYIAADCGTGHMWYMNAREQRIGRWENDPWATRGTETLEIITPSMRKSLFANPDGENCKVTFSFGTAVWEKTIGEANVKTTAFVPFSNDARVFIIEMRGAEGAQIAWQTELVLSGDDRDAVQVETSCQNGVFKAKNPRGAYPEAELIACSEYSPVSFTCDRQAWLRGELMGEQGTGYDPCMAAIYPAGVILVLVCGIGDEEELKNLAKPENALRALEETKAGWQSMCSRIRVKTPNEALNRYLNGWGVYQTLACRMMGRSSMYQSGGAYGYRDQLQDAVNMIAIAPELARKQILSACAHQFEEGDVQHWWHPGSGAEKGVRTRCSDDLLWLPWALCEYVEKTGDKGVLTDRVSFISSPVLREDEGDRYEAPKISENQGTVLEHAGRALDLVIKRGTGKNGLFLMGTGDWNDGMDKVGEKGSGESIWLTWFFSHVAERFSKLTGEEHYEAEASRAGKAADSAWDGDWYLRGFFDDGTALGSRETRGGCTIDSIAQSFSALCTESDPEKRKTALQSAVNRLFDRERGIVKLFDPPFSEAPRDPGYVQSYGKGFRENGGQYTHGAIWLAMGCFMEGMAEDGYEILSALLPENRDLSVYQAEPYVIAADVYTARGREGEAGWSWYTGSSGWFFRVALEELLGLKQRDGRLYIEPCLPQGWDGFEISWHGQLIKVSGGKITVDEAAYDSKRGIKL